MHACTGRVFAHAMHATCATIAILSLRPMLASSPSAAVSSARPEPSATTLGSRSSRPVLSSHAWPPSPVHAAKRPPKRTVRLEYLHRTHAVPSLGWCAQHRQRTGRWAHRVAWPGRVRREVHAEAQRGCEREADRAGGRRDGREADAPAEVGGGRADGAGDGELHHVLEVEVHLQHPHAVARVVCTERRIRWDLCTAVRGRARRTSSASTPPPSDLPHTRRSDRTE